LGHSFSDIKLINKIIKIAQAYNLKLPTAAEYNGHGTFKYKQKKK